MNRKTALWATGGVVAWMFVSVEVVRWLRRVSLDLGAGEGLNAALVIIGLAGLIGLVLPGVAYLIERIGK